LGALANVALYRAAADHGDRFRGVPDDVVRHAGVALARDHDLGLSTFVVGLVTGRQFAAALLSRMLSRHYADRRGAKNAVVIGLIIAAVSSALHLFSLRYVGAPS
jgi:MFS family permease